MISYNLYSTPKENYITGTISNDTRMIAFSNYLTSVRIIFQDGLTESKEIQITKERFNKLVQRVARKILCTVQ